MTRLMVHGPRLSAHLFFVALGLAFAPISALAQNTYVFNSASVFATATSKSQQTFGTSYNDSENCSGGTCSGSKLSANGFSDYGHSGVYTTDGNGRVISQAAGDAQNSTTATTNAQTGVSLSVSTLATSLAQGNYPGGYAQSPAIYKPPMFRDGTSMAMAWNVNATSTLTVNNLVATNFTVLQGGFGFAQAGWQITVTAPNGRVTTYNQQTNGSSFTATIPANSVVSISWFAMTGAQASYSGAAATANATAAVTGSVTIGP